MNRREHRRPAISGSAAPEAARGRPSAGCGPVPGRPTKQIPIKRSRNIRTSQGNSSDLHSKLFWGQACLVTPRDWSCHRIRTPICPGGAAAGQTAGREPSPSRKLSTLTNNSSSALIIYNGCHEVHGLGRPGGVRRHRLGLPCPGVHHGGVRGPSCARWMRHGIRRRPRALR